MGWSNWFDVRLGRRAGKNPISAAIGRMIGLWSKQPTIDYSRNNYDLWQALYYSSVVNGEGHQYVRGSSTAKPIVNSTAAFALGSGFEVQVEGADAVPQYKEAEERLNAWIQETEGDTYDTYKFSLRDGDGFQLIREDGTIEELAPDTVEVILSPLTGRVEGYDVTEIIQEGLYKLDTIAIVRQFRTTSVRYVRLIGNQNVEQGQVIYERIYTEDGVLDPMVDLEDDEDAPLVEYPLPVIHFANEPERKSIYGNSELQNLLHLYYDYNSVLKGAVENDVYNNNPMLTLSGTTRNAADEITKDTIIQFHNEKGSASYVTTDKTAQNSGTLLEYIFYNIVQASETPEFILGTAVSSSKASTSTQLPVVVKKATRKRKALKKNLQKVVDAYIWRMMMSGDPDFYRLYEDGVKVTISFPPIVDEDMNLTRDTIDMLLTNDLITGETALELSAVGARIADPAEEVKRARAEAEENPRNKPLYTRLNPDDLDNELDDDGNPVEDQ